MLPDYSPSERLNKITEILAEGALELLNMTKHIEVYKRRWEQTAKIATIIGLGYDDSPVVVTD